MVICIRVAPLLVTITVSSTLSVFVTKRPFTVDTHALRAVGVGLGFLRWTHNVTATGFQLGAFLYGHFQGVWFMLRGEGGWGSFVYYLSAWGELAL